MFDIYEFEQHLNQELLQSQPLHKRETGQVLAVSEHSKEYAEWMADVDQEATEELNVTHATLAAHDIKLLDKHHGEQGSIQVVSVERSGAVVCYEVVVSQFLVGLRVLNLTDWERNRKNHTELAHGSFGKVYVLPTMAGECACKRISFTQSLVLLSKGQHCENQIRASFYDLRGVLVELAIAKLCSLIGIGVPVRNVYGFDILCFRDHAQFCMEKCLPLDSLPEPIPLEAIERRLKKCMRMMHLLQIINKDIKPQNILYSPSKKNLVFCDFGISSPIDEPQGSKSMVFKEGTLKYMSKEMRNLPAGEAGLIDLYYNDMYSLHMTLNEIRFLKVTATRKPSQQQQLDPLQNLCQAAFKVHCHQPYEVCNVEHPYRNELIRYFPELSGLNVPAPLTKFLNIDFVTSSMALIGELEYYLDMCDQSDPKVAYLFKRIRHWATSRTTIPDSHCPRQQARKQQLQRVLERELKELCSHQHLTFEQERCFSAVGLQLFQIYVVEDDDETRCRGLLAKLSKLEGDASWKTELVWCNNLCLIAFESPLSSSTQCKIQTMCDHLSRPKLSLIETLLRRHGVTELYFRLVVKLAEVTHANSTDLVLYHSKAAVCCRQLRGVEEAISYLESHLGSLDPLREQPVWTELAVLLIEHYSLVSLKTALRIAQEMIVQVPTRMYHRALYAIGKVYHDSMMYQQSLKCFELSCRLAAEFVGEREEYIKAMQRMSSICLLLGYPDKAYAYSRSVMDKCLLLRGPNNFLVATAYFCLAEVTSVLGGFRDALGFCRKGRQLTTATNKAVGLEQNWIKVYSSIYRRQIQRQPGKPKKIRLVAEVNRTLLQYIDLYREINSRSEVFASVCLFAAENLFMMGKFEEALNVLNQGYIKLIDRNLRPKMLRWIGRCHAALGRNAEAAAKLEQLGHLSVQTSDTSTSHSILYRKTIQQALLASDLKLQEKTEQAFRLLGSLEPPKADHQLLELGQRCYEIGWNSLALRILEHLQHHYPSSYQRYYMALCLNRTNKRDECITVLESLLKGDTLEGDPWLAARCCNTISEACQQQVELCQIYKAKEITALTKVLERDTTHIDAMYRLAVCFDRSGKSDRALTLLQRAFILSMKHRQPADQFAIDCGLLLFRLQVPLKPIYYLRQIQATHPEYLRACFNLCRCYFVAKQRKMFHKYTTLLSSNSTALYLPTLCDWLRESEHECITVRVLLGLPNIVVQGVGLNILLTNHQRRKRYRKERLHFTRNHLKK